LGTSQILAGIEDELFGSMKVPVATFDRSVPVFSF